MSMFREHWIGALVAYSIFFCVSFIATFVVPLVHDGLSVEWNPTVAAREPLKMAGCFAIAVLFGLWPDVDIKSKSRKIFYSMLFTLNIALILKQKYLESALLGLFAMLPIISKHRGWTHSKVTMLLLPCLFLFIPIYAAYPSWGAAWDTLPDLLRSLVKWQELPDAVRSGVPFYVASFIGYATHLHLDGILFRSRKAQRRKARATQFWV